MWHNCEKSPPAEADFSLTAEEIIKGGIKFPGKMSLMQKKQG